MLIRSKYIAAWFLLVCGVFSACRTDSTRNDRAESPYTTRESTADGGSGRFYLNREIADVMTSEHGTIWLDRPGRGTVESPSRLIRVLDLNPSAVVADIGAGTGYFSFRLADVVTSGRVLAVDVQPVLLDTISARMRREGIRNIQPILGSVDDPALPPNSVDMALIVASYHEFSHPKEMLDNIYLALKKGGRIVIVEYRAEDDTIPIRNVHRMSEAQIRRELEASGFIWRETRDVLPQQHVVVFEKPIDGD